MSYKYKGLAQNYSQSDSKYINLKCYSVKHVRDQGTAVETTTKNLAQIAET